MICWRRLVRDYEKRLNVSEAMIHFASAILDPADPEGH
jgi:hypothetical protein